jgi:short-subunit dehydrogenase
MAAVVPIPAFSIYITAKAAMIGMCESLRGELAADNIGVSAFCPGPVQTNIRESGKTRPDKFGDSGFREFEQRLSERPNSPLWMDPVECGERILRGIRRNDLYIFTHPEFKAGAEEHYRAMLAAFPDEPINEERAAAIKFRCRTRSSGSSSNASDPDDQCQARARANACPYAFRPYQKTAVAMGPRMR